MADEEQATCSNSSENDSPTIAIPPDQLGETSSPIQKKKRKQPSYLERKRARQQGK